MKSFRTLISRFDSPFNFAHHLQSFTGKPISIRPGSWAGLVFFSLIGTVTAQSLTDDSHAVHGGVSVSNSTSPTVMPEVVVVATENGGSLAVPPIQKAQAQLNQIPGGVNLIDANEINTGRADNLFDLLQGQPGVIIQSRAGTNEAKLTIRGEGLDRTFGIRGIRLLQDGIPITPTDGDGDYPSIEPLAYRYTEVYRGGNALAYGGSTLGGAINFVSRTGYDASPFEIRFEMGSYGYYKGSISSGMVLGKADYFINLTGFNRDGFQDHSATDTIRVNSNFGYRFSDQLENRIYFDYSKSHLQLSGPISRYQLEADPTFSEPQWNQFNQSRNQEVMRVADKLSYHDDHQQFDVMAYWNYRDIQHPLFWNPYFLNGLGMLRVLNNAVGGQIEYRNDADLLGQKNRLTLGFNPEYGSLEDTRYQNLDGTRGQTVSDGRELSLNLNFYGENQHYFLPTVALVTGVQVNWARRNFTDYTVGNPNGPQGQDRDYFGVNPKVGLRWEITPKAQIYANFSRSFDPPGESELQQLGGIGGNLLSVPLKAETANSVEIGTRGTYGPITWDLALYRSWVRNEMLTLNDAQGNPLGTVNGSPTIHQGIEVGVDATLWENILTSNSRMAAGPDGKDGKESKEIERPKTDRLVLKQVYNLNDFHFEHDSVYGNNALPGVPQHYYRAELLYQHPSGFYFGPNVEWVITKYPGDYANTAFNGPYATLGFKIGYESPKGFSVFFEARNLTDERYASIVEVTADASAGHTVDPNSASIFVPAEGRGFYGGFGWKF